MIILVTGASSGIGRATALAAARRGDAVVLAARNEPDLKEVQQECAALGARALVTPVDVTDAGALDAVLDRAVEELGRVDAVVHAAALMAYGRFEDVPPEVFDRVLDTNLRGTTNVARSALRVFQQQGAGHLVLVSSLLGDLVMPYMSAYLTAKWGIHGFARALQIEARRTPGIDVSILSPPGVHTPIYELAANYVGRIGRPPPPTSSLEKLARSVLGVVDSPTRKKRVGLVNPVASTIFRLLPGVYDAVATPFMHFVGLSRRTTEPHSGNVFETRHHERPLHYRQ